MSVGASRTLAESIRIIEARTFEEIERIVSGDDVPTELDRMQFWEAVAERDRDGKLFADPIPKYERVEPGLTDQKASREQGDAEPSAPKQ